VPKKGALFLRKEERKPRHEGIRVLEVVRREDNNKRRRARGGESVHNFTAWKERKLILRVLPEVERGKRETVDALYFGKRGLPGPGRGKGGGAKRAKDFGATAV